MKILQGRPWRKYGKIWGVRIDLGPDDPIAYLDLVQITAKSGKTWFMSARRVLEQTPSTPSSNANLYRLTTLFLGLLPTTLKHSIAIGNTKKSSHI